VATLPFLERINFGIATFSCLLRARSPRASNRRIVRTTRLADEKLFRPRRPMAYRYICGVSDHETTVVDRFTRFVSQIQRTNCPPTMRRPPDQGAFSARFTTTVPCTRHSLYARIDYVIILRNRYCSARRTYNETVRRIYIDYFFFYHYYGKPLKKTRKLIGWFFFFGKKTIGTIFLRIIPRDGQQWKLSTNSR